MPQRKIGRREFLKLAIAAAGAAGLSHFRILNIGGADVALAQEDDCTVPGNDVCDPNGDFGPASPDTCPEGGPLPPAGATDSCDANNPDFCEPGPFGEPDDCTGLDPDVCDINDADDCIATGTDTCEPGQTPDYCDPLGAVGPADPDYCTPQMVGGPPGDEDVCPDPPPGDGDVCYFDGTFYDPDICDTTEPYTDEDECLPPQIPDLCIPGTDPDSPNPVTVGPVGVEAAASILPSLGGVAAALGAAALWLRHRLRPEKPEEEEST